MGLVETIEAAEFIGQEFATWLYWLSETHQGKIAPDGVGEFELFFESPVQLVHDYGDATVVALRGGTPLESPEARQSLRENKKIARAHLRVNRNNQTFTFTFNASNFSLAGLTLPIPPNVSPADYLYIRLEMIEEFEAFWESVFRAFLKIRLDAKLWEGERRKLAAWIKSFELA
ncbi:MAG: hypothetical protein WCK47_09220 [bacterium]|nr:hypothetical protein [Candidatus Sumerlaeota bacterium]